VHVCDVRPESFDMNRDGSCARYVPGGLDEVANRPGAVLVAGVMSLEHVTGLRQKLGVAVHDEVFTAGQAVGIVH